jgi:hypothetical protein
MWSSQEHTHTVNSRLLNKIISFVAFFDKLSAMSLVLVAITPQINNSIFSVSFPFVRHRRQAESGV